MEREAARDWLNAWTEPAIYNCVIKLVKKAASAKHLALLRLRVPLLSVSFSFFPLHNIPQPSASFHYRRLHLPFFTGGFTDSAGAYSCCRPPNSVAFLNSSRSTDDLRKKSISSVTGINEKSVSPSTESHNLHHKSSQTWFTVKSQKCLPHKKVGNFLIKLDCDFCNVTDCEDSFFNIS